MNLATVLSEASKKPYLDHPTDVSTFHPPLSPMISGDGGGGGTRLQVQQPIVICHLKMKVGDIFHLNSLSDIAHRVGAQHCTIREGIKIKIVGIYLLLLLLEN